MEVRSVGRLRLDSGLPNFAPYIIFILLKFLIVATARHFITWDWESQDADEAPKYKGLIEIVSLKRFPKHLFIAWDTANHTIGK